MNTNPNPQRIARAIATGLYFDGTAFTEADASKAVIIPHEITAIDFKLVWMPAVEIIDRAAIEAPKPANIVAVQFGGTDIEQAAKRREQVQNAAQLGLNEVINVIRKALRERSGKNWSVTRGSGTSYSWLTINCPPARRVDGWVPNEERSELAALLGFERLGTDGASIAPQTDCRREYIARALFGETLGFTWTPAWD